MALIDANIVLRYLLDEHQDLSVKAAELIEGRQEIFMPMEVVCEVVYVLEKVYKVDRQQMQTHLSELVSKKLPAVEKTDVLLKALECYAVTKFDFVDTLLWAYHVVEQQDVLTFDAKLGRLIEKHDHADSQKNSGSAKED
jgi:predicted nucleic-acid-binding protein